MRTRLDDFAFDLNACLAPPSHVWVKSGRCTVSPLERSVAGVKGFHAPPYAAGDLELRFVFTADGHTVVDHGDVYAGTGGLPCAGGYWRPDRIVRRGTFHRTIGGRLISFAVESRLVPLASCAGFLVSLTLRNRTERRLVMAIRPDLQPGCPNTVSLASYQWNWPAAGSPAVPAGVDEWRNQCVRLRLTADSSTTMELEHGAEAVLRFAVFADQPGAAPAPRPCLAALERDAEQDWLRRLDTADARLPAFRTDIPDLEGYWRGSLMSGLVCLWDHPEFVVQPFPATLGIEGAGLVCYLWDIGGMVPHVMSMLMEGDMRGLIKALLAVDIARHYALTPGGTGAGVAYSYSGYSLVNLFYRHACQNRADRDLLPEIAKTFLAADAGYARSGALLDYGTQDNLLETSTTGYEHIVPSPNAERAWCYDRLADLADGEGLAGGTGWRETASIVRREIRERLWDEGAGWFVCLHPDGRRELVESVQCLNVLDFDICDERMAERMLARVRPGAFLGQYGVSSMSREDERHYEVNDPDWSGAGAFVGTPPSLARILWRRGRAELAWEVMRRVLWLGRHFPYYPQEHFCDRPQSPSWKRGNAMDGFAGCEAIITGMAGFEPRLDGSMWVHPQCPAGRSIECTGYPFRGRRVDLRVSTGLCEAAVDGRVVFSGHPECAVRVLRAGGELSSPPMSSQ